MKILILGAGQVGSTLAKYLCLDDDNDITIVDQKEEMLTPLQRHLDIKTVLGYGAYPSILEKAGIKSMDMVIAVMRSDERNMVACRMAHTLYNVEKKIARIRTTEYLLRPEIFSNEAQLPVVLHCTAGKDRTGVSTAFLLSVLGVSREWIEADYILTNIDTSRQADFIEKSVGYPPGVNREGMIMAAGVPEDAMKDFLDGVEARWGSAIGYLQGIGVTLAQMDSVRLNFLE